MGTEDKIGENEGTNMTGGTLKLINPEPPPEIRKDWKQPYIAIFRKTIEDVTKKPSKATWAQQKSLFERFVLKNWTDETTGEFEVPTIEAWKSEIEWAVKDEWFMKVRGCDIIYFLSKFGTFEKYDPAKREPTDNILQYECPKCSNSFSAKRSDLLKYKDKTLYCRRCHHPYNVNDILNEPQTLLSLLPIKKPE